MVPVEELRCAKIQKISIDEGFFSAFPKKLPGFGGVDKSWTRLESSSCKYFPVR